MLKGNFIFQPSIFTLQGDMLVFRWYCSLLFLFGMHQMHQLLVFIRPVAVTLLATNSEWTNRCIWSIPWNYPPPSNSHTFISDCHWVGGRPKVWLGKRAKHHTGNQKPVEKMVPWNCRWCIPTQIMVFSKRSFIYCNGLWTPRGDIFHQWDDTFCLQFLILHLHRAPEDQPEII